MGWGDEEMGNKKKKIKMESRRIREPKINKRWENNHKY